MHISDKSMINKVCVVTGATSGIGKATATALALKGASVVIVGRNVNKCITTVNKMKSQTGNTLVNYICTDLSDLNQVRNLSIILKQKHPHIDVLINNAGAYFRSRHLSADGYEMNLALNYLGPFLLVSLIIDILKQSNQARIINVSSNAHFKAKINLDDLQSSHRFEGFEPYAQSKLALLLFTYELARRLKNTHITVNALHPGLVATNFGLNNGLFRFYLRRLLKRGEISAEEGAKTSIYLATNPDLNTVTGGYFIDQQQAKSSVDSYDHDLAKDLWKISEKLTDITDFSLI